MNLLNNRPTRVAHRHRVLNLHRQVERGAGYLNYYAMKTGTTITPAQFLWCLSGAGILTYFNYLITILKPFTL